MKDQSNLSSHSSCNTHKHGKHKHTCSCEETQHLSISSHTKDAHEGHSHKHGKHKHTCSCEESQHLSISSHKEDAHEGHSHEEGEQSLLLLCGSLVLLATAFILEKWIMPAWFTEKVCFIWYLATLILISLPVLAEGIELIFKRGDFFNEIVLMLIATVGAFAIGEYAEAIMLMLLYSLGEYFEHKASEKARGSISALIDRRPEEVTRLTPQGTEVVSPHLCKVGDLLQLVPGERVSFDGILVSENGIFDTSALTGESLPADKEKESLIQAGSIVQSHPVTIRISKPYGESTLARILEQVEESSDNKPRTERFIRRFARYYTPAVFSLSLLTVLVPFLIGLFSPHFDFVFKEWFYIALVLLVTSCPCALIISIPLSYFSGVGAASKHGLIFKGARFLEILPKVKHFIFDKTGTLTEGKFSVVREEEEANADTIKELRGYVLALEEQSSHPIATAVCEYLHNNEISASGIIRAREEVPGMGLRAHDDKGREILVGNSKLLGKYGVATDTLPLLSQEETAIYVAFEGKYCCSYVLRDKIKDSAKETVMNLQKRGINVALFSGDNPSTVEGVGREIGVNKALGGLLPQDKIAQTKALAEKCKVAFVGDGINDAPVMALCDISFAMGGIGSDAAIEAADVIIQSDDPNLAVKAIKIAEKTHRVAWQNILFALGVKAVVMILAYFEISTLILAIFADVGVTLLAVLNAVRLLRYKA